MSGPGITIARNVTEQNQEDLFEHRVPLSRLWHDGVDGSVDRLRGLAAQNAAAVTNRQHGLNTI